MFKKPKITASEMVQQLNEMRQKGNTDLLTFYKLRHQAHIFEKQDPARAYMILGMIATLEGQFDKMQAHYERAIALAPTYTATHLNYITSLQSIGLFAKALHHSKALLNQMPERLEALHLIITNAVFCCRLHEAFSYLQKWYIINPLNDFNLAKLIEEGARLLTELGLTDDEAERIYQLVFTLLYKKNIVFKNVHIDYFKDETSECLVYTIFVVCSVYKVIELNHLLDKRLNKELTDMPHDKIVFLYKSSEILTLSRVNQHTLEGHLLMNDLNEIRFRPRNYAYILTCAFDDQQRNQVYEYIFHYVRIHGTVHHNPLSGKMTHVFIETLEPIEDEENNLAQLLQTDLTQQPAMTTEPQMLNPFEGINDWQEEDFEAKMIQWRVDES
ncbi:MAG: hypothetical protein SVR94_03870 [Pseudomonadota bacterium]|nr:hypothetical protein [Pseudomonadota bacterium]